MGPHDCRGRAAQEQFSIHLIRCKIRKIAGIHIGRDNFAGICINNRGSIAGPVHLHNLTGLVAQVHGSVDLYQIVDIVLAELGGLVWNLARRLAPVAVFQPQQVQRNTAALEFLVDIFFRRRGGLARIMPDMSGTAYGFRM